jgi:hypothetical protein
MNAQLQALVAREHIADLHNQAERARRRRDASRQPAPRRRRPQIRFRVRGATA